MKILIIRPDRIGDVVLSTPVPRAIKLKYPNSKVFFLAHNSVRPVLEGNPYIDEILEFRPETLHFGFTGFGRLVETFIESKFDIAVTLQVRFSISMALLAARIPLRIGPYSKPYSMLCFNKGIRQHRSLVHLHEAQYNLQLLEPLGINLDSSSLPETLVVVNPQAQERMSAFLRTIGLSEHEDFILVHPGMGGSALNWPELHYSMLCQALLDEGHHVIVTGSLTEKALVDRVISRTTQNRGRIFPFLGSTSTHDGLRDFIALLAMSKIVVAPSTGPLHIAVALGRPTLSFYPPIRVQSKERWGPFSKDFTKHIVLVPNQTEGNNANCMEKISVSEAIRGVRTLLEECL